MAEPVPHVMTDPLLAPTRSKAPKLQPAHHANEADPQTYAGSNTYIQESPMNLKRSLRVALVALWFLSRLSSDAQSNAQPDPLFKTVQSLDTNLKSAIL